MCGLDYSIYKAGALFMGVRSNLGSVGLLFAIGLSWIRCRIAIPVQDIGWTDAYP